MLLLERYWALFFKARHEAHYFSTLSLWSRMHDFSSITQRSWKCILDQHHNFISTLCTFIAKPWDLKYLFFICLLLFMFGWCGWWNVRETWVARTWISRLQSQTLCLLRLLSMCPLSTNIKQSTWCQNGGSFFFFFFFFFFF